MADFPFVRRWAGRFRGPWILAALLTVAVVRAAPAAEGLTVVVLHADGRPAVAALTTAEALAGGERRSARAGPDGRAVLAGLPNGRYLVSARSSDFSASPVEVVVRDGRAASPQLVLRFAAVREEVVVSAALAPRRRSDSGVFVDVRSAESLEARGEWFLLEGLRGAPGVFVRQDGGPGHLADLRIRGLPGSSTAIVVDGAPIRDAAAVRGDGASLLSSLGLLGVERVEIRRGGGSTIYGTNGMGGVLHITTRDETAPDAARLSAGFGSKGQAAAAGAWGVAGERGGISLGLGHLGVSRGADGDDPFRNRSAVARAGLRLTPSLRVSLRALYSDASVGLNEDAFPLGSAPPAGVVTARAAPSAALRNYEAGEPLAGLDFGTATFMPASNDPDATQGTRFRSILFTVRGTPTADLAWSLRFHDLATRRRNEDGPGGRNPFDPAEAQAIRYHGGLRTAAARLEVAGGRHRLLAGGEIERERAQTFDPAFDTRLGQSSAAVFAQGETRSGGGRASVRAAVRAQRFATREAELTPAAGSPWRGTPPPPAGGAISGDASGSFELLPGFRLRGSWGRGFRAPSLYERFGTWYSPFGYSVFGDPRLLPEFTTSLDAGFSLESADGRREARGAFFRSVRRRIIGFGSFDPAADPFGRFGGYENTEAGVARGAELALRFALRGRTRVGLQYTRTEADPPGNAPPELGADWLLPRRQAGALLSGALGERLHWSADLHLASAIHAPLFDRETFATRVFRFRGMRRLDLAVSLELSRGLTLRALVQDALDDAGYQSGGFRPLGRAFRVGLAWRPR